MNAADREAQRRKYERIAAYLNKHAVNRDTDGDLQLAYDSSGMYLTPALGRWVVMEGPGESDTEEDTRG